MHEICKNIINAQKIPNSSPEPAQPGIPDTASNKFLSPAAYPKSVKMHNVNVKNLCPTFGISSDKVEPSLYL